MTDILNLIQTIATVVAAFSIVLVWKQLKADHERSRREKSLALMSEWNSARFRSGRAQASVITLVEHLSEKQCQSLWERRSIKIPKDLEPMLTSISSVFKAEGSIKITDDGLNISEPLISLMRDYVVHYLNSLEIIAAAWRHHTIDRDIIEEEFIGIFSKQKNSFPYEAFRKASGVYPSIHDLRLAIEAKENKRVNKGPIA